jgi:transposase
MAASSSATDWNEPRPTVRSVRSAKKRSTRLQQLNDMSRSLAALDQDSTVACVIEMGRASWLAAAVVPGVARHRLKKIDPDQEQLWKVLRRWKEEAEKAGRTITGLIVAFEAGRDGFWLARWLRARD